MHPQVSCGPISTRLCRGPLSQHETRSGRWRPFDNNSDGPCATPGRMSILGRRILVRAAAVPRRFWHSVFATVPVSVRNLAPAVASTLTCIEQCLLGDVFGSRLRVALVHRLCQPMQGHTWCHHVFSHLRVGETSQDQHVLFFCTASRTRTQVGLPHTSSKPFLFLPKRCSEQSPLPSTLLKYTRMDAAVDRERDWEMGEATVSHCGLRCIALKAVEDNHNVTCPTQNETHTSKRY